MTSHAGNLSPPLIRGFLLGSTCTTNVSEEKASRLTPLTWSLRFLQVIAKFYGIFVSDDEPCWKSITVCYQGGNFLVPRLLNPSVVRRP
jgi:hypothetical protein